MISVASNETPASSWSKQIAPNIILPTCNSGASVCIAIEVAQGIAVSWWRRAMKRCDDGRGICTTPGWAFGSSIASVLLNVKYFNIAALAAIVKKGTIIDGILFQRSTSTYIQLGPSHEVNIDLMVGVNTLTFLIAHNLSNRQSRADTDEPWDSYSHSTGVFVPATRYKTEEYYQTQLG
ncbi:uncharacterized protein A1O5_01736 [Cladophialophora psammophila CBS 110553]|uniref:Uncharacterized protein n=1 Tax=Cladophialophora psammophila CBS 110553 TaxID=1182543 RepID=W9XCK0_9EURO|nr:uncharacterized protein A1O5_01736 [Cladophialophora psammophila CBS 110553]EXJ75040.1 hypothetical protein A1O5_01736 [Cladophialophora psammophila CBS 110553]